MVWKQTSCAASSRIKALQRLEKKRCSEQKGGKNSAHCSSVDKNEKNMENGKKM